MASLEAPEIPRPVNLPAALIEHVEDLRTSAASITVTDAATYQAAGALLKDVARLARDLETERKVHTRPLDEAKRAVMDLFDGPKRTLSEAETKLKREMMTFDARERAARQEAERRIREENERRAQEARELAAMASAEGDIDAAVELTFEAEMVETAPVLPTQAAEVNGISFREISRAEITSLHALVSAAASDPARFLSLLEVNTQALTARLKAGEQIPGAKLVTERVTAVRA